MEQNSEQPCWYDNLKRKELLHLLKARDKEIDELRRRTIEDYIRDVMSSFWHGEFGA